MFFKERKLANIVLYYVSDYDWNLLTPFQNLGVFLIWEQSFIFQYQTTKTVLPLLFVLEYLPAKSVYGQLLIVLCYICLYMCFLQTRVSAKEPSEIYYDLWLVREASLKLKLKLLAIFVVLWRRVKEENSIFFIVFECESKTHFFLLYDCNNKNQHIFVLRAKQGAACIPTCMFYCPKNYRFYCMLAVVPRCPLDIL